MHAFLLDVLSTKLGVEFYTTELMLGTEVALEQPFDCVWGNEIIFYSIFVLSCPLRFGLLGIGELSSRIVEKTLDTSMTVQRFSFNLFFLQEFQGFKKLEHQKRAKNKAP